MLAFAGALLGCDDGRRPVAYHPPAIQGVVQASAPPAAVLGSLPLNAARLKTTTFLASVSPDGPFRRPSQAVGAAGAATAGGSQAKPTVSANQGGRNPQVGGSAASGTQTDRRASGAPAGTAPAQAGSGGPAVTAAAGEDANAADQPPTVASPIDEIADSAAVSAEGVPAEPVDASLRKNAEREVTAVSHDLPLTVNDIVLSFVKFFQTPHGRAIVETGLRRAGRYRPMIEGVLREEGLPSDLIYIAQAESAFQPQALSRAGARGLWQFMSYRGKQYGLEHDWWSDDRQDPEKATRAAAHHLRDLYEMFGDWYLVMAAYNSGPGSVQHAVERTGYADFWELYRLNVLPKETKNYVPIILALTLIAKDPARYGVDVDPEPPLRADLVHPGHSLDLRLVSETLGVDVDVLRGLNPELLHLTTPTDPAFGLRLPEGSTADFELGMSAIPADKWLLWRRHRVEDGETLASVARKYRLNTGALAEANDLEPQAALTPGANLILPLSAESQSGTGQLVRYRVRKSDTMSSVADEFDVTAADLRRWNHIRGNVLPVGVRIRIYPGGSGAPSTTASASSTSGTQPRTVERTSTATVLESPQVRRAGTGATARPGRGPVESAKAADQTVTHKVKAGETLYSIAQAYQTTVDALRKGNQFLFSRSLQAGDTLTILPPR